MISLGYAQAGKYNVLPLDGRGTLRRAGPRPTLTKERGTDTSYPGTQVIPEGQVPRLLNRYHRIIAEVEVPKFACPI